MRIFINPGTGPVQNATKRNAEENIKHFIADCGKKGIKSIRIPHLDYGEGRFAFLLWKDTRCHEIQMPGLPLSQVRYMGYPEQNICDFPRLYVDGSSWVWKYALLTDPDDWTLEYEKEKEEGE